MEAAHTESVKGWEERSPLERCFLEFHEADACLAAWLIEEMREQEDAALLNSLTPAEEEFVISEMAKEGDLSSGFSFLSGRQKQIFKKYEIPDYGIGDAP